MRRAIIWIASALLVLALAGWLGLGQWSPDRTIASEAIDAAEAALVLPLPPPAEPAPPAPEVVVGDDPERVLPPPWTAPRAIRPAPGEQPPLDIVPHTPRDRGVAARPLPFPDPPPPPAPALPDTGAWLSNAVAVLESDGKPMLAVVIDDLGLDRTRTGRALHLMGPLTMAFLPYGPELAKQAAEARARGHELLLHMPMQPMGAGLDPGPDALETGLGEALILARLRAALGRFEGYVGINNHMGSRFTAETAGMRVVMAELRLRGLLFLDSRTTGASVAEGLSRQLGVPSVARDIFLDNVPTRAAVRHQLDQFERLARKAGHAVAIGHPHDATLGELAAWLPSVAERGFVLVPVSTIAKRRNHIAKAD
ncbi:MAG: divergent polysaccharide deacetylase family protein [Alphaproteobacteria bacterium]|nr:divergent polysaccharide deacetylase family protein [Alphaproteobacteria bacterium]